MTLYHVTSCANAAEIIRRGFRDPHDGRFSDACVWFADKPLCDDEMFDDERASADADKQCAVVLDIPDEVVSEYEDIKFRADHPDHREWCIPYAIANQYIGEARVQPCP